MPGLLIMNSSGADAREGESRKRTHDGRLVNGDRSSKNDGSAANGTTPSANMAGTVTSVKGSKASAFPNNADEHLGLPPEIAEVGPEFYRSLSKLYQRMAQECFNSLNDVLNAMADFGNQSNGVTVNGMGGHLNRQPDDSESNKQKRKLLLDFAYENRAKFIKLLVLTNWADEKARPIKKVIDIWKLEQNTTQAYDSIGPLLTDIKYFLNHLLREQNPDIRTALQILSKGTAEWIPDVSCTSGVVIVCTDRTDGLHPTQAFGS
jgi:mediator of RNA polymerase II transcription subunit 14